MTIKIGSIWFGNNFEQFQVDAVEPKGQEVWVHYHKVSNTSQVYSCLVDAFLQRFSRMENTK